MGNFFIENHINKYESFADDEADILNIKNRKHPQIDK